MNVCLRRQLDVDGCWIGEIPELPGAFSDDNSAEDAMSNDHILTLCVMAEWLENNASEPKSINLRHPQQPTRLGPQTWERGCRLLFSSSDGG